MEDDEEISAVNVSCFVDETEWTICDLVYSEPKVVSRESESQCKNPLLNVRCCAIRKAGFFMYNIILIMVRIQSSQKAIPACIEPVCRSQGSSILAQSHTFVEIDHEIISMTIHANSRRAVFN